MAEPATKRAAKSPLETYLADVKKRFSTGKATEASYYPTLQNLVETLEKGISATSQAKRIKCGSPDFVVTRKKVPLGYIEAKDLGASLAKIEDSDQLLRYRSSLGNLILTNYLDFFLYVNGEKTRIASIAKMSKNGLDLLPENFNSFTSLLAAFFSSNLPTISTPGELATRLASATSSIKDLIIRAFKLNDTDSQWLNKWLQSFREVLLSDLSIESFADMFAQTLSYGFFAARVHHSELKIQAEFSRFSAAKVLPKTNPFLRKLFAEFAGIDMPDTINWAVDEIVEILKRVNLDEVLKHFNSTNGRNDPVVHFYETFLTQYDSDLRAKRGVYYTPQPIVDFIVRSVDELLSSKFGKEDGLADDNTLILDPAAGTASFLYRVVDLVKERFAGNQGAWDSYVSENLLKRIFGFEILMAPYSIAHLKLGMQLQESGYSFSKGQRLGVYLTNTLEESARRTEQLFLEFIADEANAAAEVKSDKPIMVVLGNPPYSGHSANSGEWITKLMRGYDTITKTDTESYFLCDGKSIGEKNPKWLNDDYVKFIRFSQWRIDQTGHGILALITNHGFIDNPTFRGMRWSLMNSFDDMFILDLHGNLKKKETSPDQSKDENVFDIQQGVSISFFVKKPASELKIKKRVFKADLWGLREEKYAFLERESVKSVKWIEIKPSSPTYHFTEQDEDLSVEYKSGWRLADIFHESTVGIVTSRDSLSIHFSEDEAMDTIRDFASLDTEEARSKYDLGKDVQDWKVNLAQEDLKNSGLDPQNIQKILYRPFDVRYTYYTGTSRGFHCRPRFGVMRHMLDNNIALISARTNKSPTPDHFFCSKFMSEAKAGEATTQSYIFPLYLKSSAGEAEKDLFGLEEIPNFSGNFSSFIEEFRAALKKDGRREETSTLDVFKYIYAVTYSSSYRGRYADFLKNDFARIPFTTSHKTFSALCNLGSGLVDLHTMESELLKKPLAQFPVKGSGVVDKVEYNAKKHCISINKEQEFTDVSNEIWSFSVGGYQICEKWLKFRRSRTLGLEDIRNFCRIVEAIRHTLSFVKKIDETIKLAGGLPLKNVLSYRDDYAIKTNTESERKDGAIPTTRSAEKKPGKSKFDNVLDLRLAVSAKIVDSLKDDVNFGRVKFAKVLYLAEKCANLNLDTNYVREVAGPLDQRALYNKKYGIEPLAEKNSIFTSKTKFIVVDGEKRKVVNYLPAKKLSEFSKSFESKVGDNSKVKEIQRVIKLVEPMTTDQLEIVATLYAAWNDLLLRSKGKEIADKKIITEFREHWHEKKKRFSENQLTKALTWMRKHKLVPEGKGKSTSIKRTDDIDF